MTQQEAKEKLRLLRQENERLHDECDRLLSEGKLSDAADVLIKITHLIDFKEICAIALIAEGKEPLS